MSPSIAQLVEHATVEVRGNREVPGSIPGGRIFLFLTSYKVVDAD